MTHGPLDSVLRLDGRIALVTGGGGGLGGATAEILAEAGATVVVSDIDQAAAERVAAACRNHMPDSVALAADVTDPAAVAAVFDEVAHRWGRLEVLVTTAGVSAATDPTPTAATDPLFNDISTLSDAAWRRMLSVHLDGTFFCIRSAVPLMRAAGRGSIVCMSSIAGLAGIGPPHYSAAKGGILGLVRALARSLGPEGIRINAVCPGAIDAGMTLLRPREVVEAFLPQIPVGRFGAAREIGHAVLYLASDASSYTTGQWTSPNGGSVIS